MSEGKVSFATSQPISNPL